jgi:hypothetical protein
MDALFGPLIAVTGVIVGAVLTGWYQRANTRAVIQSEYRKIAAQLTGQSRARFRGRKEDWLLEFVPELVAATDPELHADFDYVKIVTLIHRIQVVLDVNSPNEGALNHATTALGLAVQSVKSGGADPTTLLGPQSEVVEAARKFFHEAP